MLVLEALLACCVLYLCRPQAEENQRQGVQSKLLMLALAAIFVCCVLCLVSQLMIAVAWVLSACVLASSTRELEARNAGSALHNCPCSISHMLCAICCVLHLANLLMSTVAWRLQACGVLTGAWML